MQSTRAELMSPAGDHDAMRAAVAGGADAVYFGLADFNARIRAANFTAEELPDVMGFLHDRNVRGYVTVNTLIFSDELPTAAALGRRLAECGADAVIVQDLGLAALLARMAPDLHLHGSTQMTLTEPRGIEWVRARTGIRRVVLARELSVAEIRRVAAAVSVPVEVFIHGALCVAYSGQCLTSESLGGRSANRGQCAQACRLPYEMVVDGERVDLGDRAYLLSPQDLAAPDLVDELVKAGVACLKIEGRLKSAHYVAATTGVYRVALDAALAGRPFALTPDRRVDLEQSFSRGLTHGFLDGADHQRLVAGRFPKSRGVRVGAVDHRTVDGFVVKVEPGLPPSALPKPGDGLVFDEGHPEQDEQGGRVFGVRPAGPGLIEVAMGHGSIRAEAVPPGSLVWKTDDPAMKRRLERTYATDRPVRRVPLSARLTARADRVLRLELTDPEGRCGAAEWDRAPEPALKRPLTMEAAREQAGRLGDTPFELAELVIDAGDGVPAPVLTAPVMVPKSVLNDLRRRAVDDLNAARDASRRITVVEPDALDRMRAEITAKYAPGGSAADRFPVPAQPAMVVLARTPGQLAAVCTWEPPAGVPRPAMVYCDFEDVRRYPDAVAVARTAGLPIALAAVRILKPGEEGLLRQVETCGPDAVLARNPGTLEYFSGRAGAPALIADYGMNVANELTADILAGAGVRRMTAGYDLNWEQLGALLTRFPAAAFEAVIHQHMPMFHMEHCVFAAFLSTGRDSRDCGRPCDRHRVDLSDRVGSAHPVMADVGCRNTVFNAVAQSAAEYVPRMRELGLRWFRVELLREEPGAVGALLERYGRVVAGLEDGRTTWRSLRVLNQLGVTRGTLQHELNLVR